MRGGRHAGHGTANRIVPLGPNYIELLTVVDEKEASSSPLGSWVLSRLDTAEANAVCLRTENIEAICDRLGLEAEEMSRVREDAVRLNWRLAGLEQALARHLPFFVEWDVEADQHPGRRPVTHPAGNVRLTSVTFEGNATELRGWAPQPNGLHYVHAATPAIRFNLESG